MFTGEERARIHSTRSFDNLLDQIKDSLELIGNVHMSRKGDFDIRMARHNSFAWETVVEGWVEERKKDNEYNISISYKINPTPAGLILAIIFFMPVGLILLFLVLNAQSEIKKLMIDALREIEDNLDERR